MNICDFFKPREDFDPGRRKALGLVAKVLGVASAYPIAKTAEKILGYYNNAYAEQAEESVSDITEMNVSNYDQLGDILQKDENVLVMYTTSDPNMPDEYRTRGNEVWEIFKENLGNQVTKYIKADSNEWYDKAKNEIGKKVIPSFVYYPKNTSLKDDTKDCVIVPGIPDDPYDALNFIKESAGLE